MKAWLKGGLIGMVTSIIIIYFHIPLPQLYSILVLPISFLFFETDVYPLWYLWPVLGPIYFFFIGSLIGWVIGKIWKTTNKKQEGSSALRPNYKVITY